MVTKKEIEQLSEVIRHYERVAWTLFKKSQKKEYSGCLLQIAGKLKEAAMWGEDTIKWYEHKKKDEGETK